MFIKCEDCGHEYLLAFSCKRRHFCPSCHQKRVVGFGEWLCTEVLKHVQSFGDFQNFNPHLHALATDGCFYHDAAFMVCPPPDTGELEKLFR